MTSRIAVHLHAFIMEFLVGDNLRVIIPYTN